MIPGSMTKLATLFLALTLATVVAEEARNYAVSPVPRDAGWMTRHQSFNAISKEGKAPLVFLGDSITQGWSGKGKAAWEKAWAPLGAANFGIGGDRTEHVLWRLDNGNFDGLKPKLIVLMIGTNNTGHVRPPAEGAERRYLPVQRRANRRRRESHCLQTAKQTARDQDPAVGHLPARCQQRRQDAPAERVDQCPHRQAR